VSSRPVPLVTNKPAETSCRTPQICPYQVLEIPAHSSTNRPVHTGQPVCDLCRGFPRLHLVAFPSYAAELNPDEGV